MRFKKSLITFLTAVLMLVGSSALVSGQNLDYLEYLTRFLEGESVARVRAVDDTDPAIVIHWIQGEDSTTTAGVTTVHGFAKVAVDAAGDLTFTQDATDGTTASLELECPVSAPLGGIINVSDGDCDTFGEVVDIINGSTSWRAVLVGALRTDTWDATSILIDTADFEVQSLEGDSLYWDNSTAFKASWVVSDKKDFTSFYGRSGSLLSNPWDGTRAVVRYLLTNVDFDAGTSFVLFYAVKTDLRAGTETVTTLYRMVGGTDAANKTIVDFTMFGGILGRTNEKLLVRLETSSNMSDATATVINGFGTEFASR